MTKEEKQKLNEKELYKLFDKGDIDAREFDELRNHEYFNIDGDYTLDPVIEKAKAKVPVII